jgi:hypothetical protein
VISDWFWDSDKSLRKSFISIDVEGARYGVRRVLRLLVDEPSPVDQDVFEANT